MTIEDECSRIILKKLIKLQVIKNNENINDNRLELTKIIEGFTMKLKSKFYTVEGKTF